MITLVSAGLRIDNVVFHGDYFDITLIADHLRDLIDVRCKGTYDADACYVIDIADHVING